MTVDCPHCGRPDVPAEGGRVDRHYRADHRSGVDPGNQLCLASFTRPRVGEHCDHVPPNPNCVGRT